MLEAFFDEGSTHSGAKLLSVGGFVGEHDQWTQFLALWGSPDFHSKESDKLKPLLSRIIHQCQLDGFVVSVSPIVYRTFGSHRWRSAMGNAYAICAFSCVMAVQAHIKKPVAYVIEAGQPNSEWVERVIRAMQEDEHFGPLIHSVTVAKKDGVFQLHAADFIAHSWSTSPQNPFWQDEIKGRGGIVEAEITSQMLVNASAQLDEILRRKRHAKVQARRKQGE